MSVLKFSATHNLMLYALIHNFDDGVQAITELLLIRKRLIRHKVNQIKSPISGFCRHI